jgi:hypothetical protein
MNDGGLPKASDYDVLRGYEPGEEDVLDFRQRIATPSPRGYKAMSGSKPSRYAACRKDREVDQGMQRSWLNAHRCSNERSASKSWDTIGNW